MPGKITVLKAENATMITSVNILTALQTAAAGSAGSRVKIKRLEIGQSHTTTLAMVRGQIATRDTAGTLTLTSLAPTTLRPVGGGASGIAGSTAPAGGTARSGITGSVDSGGTYTQLWPFAFPNTAGYLFKPDPDEQIEIPASTLFVVRFLADPSDLLGWTFTLVLEEE